jgi:hypothetical protein
VIKDRAEWEKSIKEANEEEEVEKKTMMLMMMTYISDTLKKVCTR